MCPRKQNSNIRKKKTVTLLTEDELPADNLPDKTCDMDHAQKDRGKGCEIT